MKRIVTLLLCNFATLLLCPIGLVFALFWNKLGVHPNVITILSIFLGVGAGWMFHYTDLAHNIWGVILLMFANFCDSTDGGCHDPC